MNNFVFKIELKENYSNAFTKEKLGDHITAVFDYVSNIIEDKSVFSNKYKFSDQLYWECIDEIFENNIINDFLDYDLIEEELYEVIKSDLGEYYDDKDFYALDSLDFTISNYINNLRYKDSLGNYNPFSINNEILEKSGVLYTFTENIEHSYLRRTNKKKVN